LEGTLLRIQLIDSWIILHNRNMRQKHLESALSSIKREFPAPNITLEQYPTSPHLTACVILTAISKHDIGPHRSACDLGCGTGMLAIGCALVETDFVLAIDCDTKALERAVENVQEMELDCSNIMFVLGKVNTGVIDVNEGNNNNLPDKPNGSRSFHGRGGRGRGRGSHRGGRGTGERQQRAQQENHPDNLISRLTFTADDADGLPFRSNCVDTVLSNPPFGTKNNAGMDIRFLKAATRLAKRAVYSFHKTSTRPFLVKTVQEWGYQLEIVAEMKFDLPQTYKFHKEKSVDIEVDLVRVILSDKLDDGSEGSEDSDRKSESNTKEDDDFAALSGDEEFR